MKIYGNAYSLAMNELWVAPYIVLSVIQ